MLTFSKLFTEYSFHVTIVLMIQLKAKSYKPKAKYIIGIDEVGRGPLAGPVVVAALALPPNSKFKNQKSKLQLKDSKRLSREQREIWFAYIRKQPHIFYTTAIVLPKIIDKINISQAANLAASLALAKLIKNYKLRMKNCRIFLDGGLYTDNSKIKNQKSKLQLKNIKCATIVKGDEKVPAIMMASIVAKVTRDRIMSRLHKKYPAYGFDEHKGYGTKKHRRAIKKNGYSPIHRRSFTLKK